MSNDRQIYLLDPKQLNPETIAVTFAKTSRSPESFREIAASLSSESSAQFNEKWVIGYGHSSVAEHAILHIAIENVSRLAVETIESNRLASYTEKSTRFQKWDANSFFVPKELDETDLLEAYKTVCTNLFTTYLNGFNCVKHAMARETPRKENESAGAYDRRVRTATSDVCRYLLPASSLANLGMTINARALEHSLQKMLSSSFQEVREIGEEIKRISSGEIPTLIKYAERQPYLEESGRLLKSIAAQTPARTTPEDWCTLVDWDREGEERVLAAALYRYGHADAAACQEYVRALGPDERLKIFSALVGQRERHDLPLRELEHITYTFDVTIDQGAYYEVKRHRMMTQTVQDLTGDLGYAVPRALVSAGFGDAYKQAMDASLELYRMLKGINPDLAEYGVPNGFHRRLLLTMNLREAFHFCSLRAAPNAHFSVRRLAQRMAEQIGECHPLFAEYMGLPRDETWQSLTESYFFSA